MSVESMSPGEMPGHDDLEVLAARNSFLLEQRLMGWSTGARGEHDIDLAVALPHLVPYSHQLTTAIYLDTPEQAVGVVYRSLMFGALVGLELLGPKEWGMSPERLGEFDDEHKLREYIDQAPRVYFSNRPVLKRIVDAHMSDICPLEHIIYADSAEIVTGLAFLQTDMHLLSKYALRQAEEASAFLDAWDGALPDDFDA